MIRHRVAATPPIAGRTAVKFYPGYGILGADLPTAGDSGGSPVLNDGISADNEYHWRVVTPPASGTLTINRDLSFFLEGAADGVWTWTYRLFENNADQGTASVVSQVGVVATLITGAASQQGNVASAGAIQQTHMVAGAASVSGAVASAGSVSQSPDAFVAGANSTQGNTASAGVVRQTHLVSGAGSRSGNSCSSGLVVSSAPGGSVSLTPEDIAAIADAVWAKIFAAAQTTPIHADARKMNGAAVIGNGSDSDKWRGAGV